MPVVLVKIYAVMCTRICQNHYSRQDLKCGLTVKITEYTVYIGQYSRELYVNLNTELQNNNVVRLTLLRCFPN